MLRRFPLSHWTMNGLMKRYLITCFLLVFVSSALPQDIISLQKTFDELASHLQRRKFDKAYDMMSAKSQSVVSREQFAAMFQTLEAENGKLQSFSKALVRTQRARELGLIVAHQRYKSRDLLMAYLFRPENGGWRLVEVKPASELSDTEKNW